MKFKRKGLALLLTAWLGLASISDANAEHKGKVSFLTSDKCRYILSIDRQLYPFFRYDYCPGFDERRRGGNG